MKQQIPNSLTLLNVFCGACALVFLSKGAYTEGVALIGVSLVADFLDGAVARWLGVSSEMGKELDSLADMVTFGLVPGYILYTLLALAWSPVGTAGVETRALPAFLVTAFSCYRLAKFNLDTRQSEGFIGLATPANTLFFIGLLLLKNTEWAFILDNKAVLYGLIPLSSYLLVSEIPMFSFKFKSFSWKGNEIRFIFAGVAVLLLGVAQTLALAPLIMVYVFLNTGFWLIKPRRF